MSSPNQTFELAADLGRRGEELAAAYLQQLGYRLVAANFTVPVGRNRNGAVVNVKIDLVAYDGPVLCFVEVKTRTSDWFAPPTANVDLRKQRQVTRGAFVYRRLFDRLDEAYRFDVVSIVLPTPTASDSQNFLETAPSAPRGVQIELHRGFWANDKFRKHRDWVSWD